MRDFCIVMSSGKKTLRQFYCLHVYLMIHISGYCVKLFFRKSFQSLTNIIIYLFTYTPHFLELGSVLQEHFTAIPLFICKNEQKHCFGDEGYKIKRFLATARYKYLLNDT